MNPANCSGSSAGWKRLRKLFGIGITLVVIVGCAPKLRMQAAQLDSEHTMGPAIILKAPATGSSSAGYARTLSSKTRWLKIGTIRQGDVLKPLDSVLTAEAGHVREAYIVVRQNMWVGFWLPVEKAFSPLGAATPINFYRGDQK
jgi:hypothetical protein